MAANTVFQLVPSLVALGWCSYVARTDSTCVAAGLGISRNASNHGKETSMTGEVAKFEPKLRPKKHRRPLNIELSAVERAFLERMKREFGSSYKHSVSKGLALYIGLMESLKSDANT